MALFPSSFGRWLARRLRPRPAATALELRLYTRAGCPLCDEMKAELARACTRHPYTLLEVDIEGDAELLARHGRSIPVLEIAGKVAFKGRLAAADFERKLARRAAEIRAEEASARRSGAGESGHG